MAVVATGFFDGVHTGHRKVVEALVAAAARRGEESIVVTFSQHPRAVFQQDARSLRLLSSREEKVAMLTALGVDRVEVLPFNAAFGAMTAREYIREVLVRGFGASCVVLGYDNRFGSDGLSTRQLSELLASEGLECEVVSPLEDGARAVSSTRIRACLEEGKVQEAAAMLGYDYTLTGVVVPGKQLGRRIGFPTANLQMKEPLKQLPGRGVYLTRTEVTGELFMSMTNVGDIVETHLLDFDRDIYSLDISVSFLSRVRDMMDFPDIESLAAQLRKDEAACRLEIRKHFLIFATDAGSV